ncbi:MAG: ankyrin repeat domain-containing protein [Actinomycetota bacterium]
MGDVFMKKARERQLLRLLDMISGRTWTSESADTFVRELTLDSSLVSGRYKMSGGWKPADQGGTLLHIAMDEEVPGAVRALLEHGADPNAMYTDEDSAFAGWTPLHLWAGNYYSHKNYEAAEILLAAGADINSRDAEGYTPLCKSLSSSRGQDEQYAVSKIVRWLIEHGANVTISSNNGMSPVEIARKEFGSEELPQVLEVLALIEERSEPPSTVVEAARRGDAQALNTLLRQGSPNEQHDGRSALHWAVSSGQKDAVQALIDGKARLDATDNDGWTPLHVAAWNESIEVVRCLIQAGADRNLRENLRHMTAADMAAERRNVQLVSILRAEPASPKRR